MNFNKSEQDELIENYCECNGGLICINGDELQNGDEYYMDKEECIRMINDNFSTDDSIIHLTHNNYATPYLEIYRKSDGYYFDNGGYDIDEKNVYYILCPPSLDDEYKQWFKDLIKFINKKAKNGYKSEDINIICHDECCQTWDSIDLDLMRMGEEYTECTIDHCDYEVYEDTDIANLVEKIMNDWDNVKTRIEDIINRIAYGYAYKMNGFCMIIEEN